MPYLLRRRITSWFPRSLQAGHCTGQTKAETLLSVVSLLCPLFCSSFKCPPKFFAVPSEDKGVFLLELAASQNIKDHLGWGWGWEMEEEVFKCRCKCRCWFSRSELGSEIVPMSLLVMLLLVEGSHCVASQGLSSGNPWVSTAVSSWHLTFLSACSGICFPFITAKNSLLPSKNEFHEKEKEGKEKKHKPFYHFKWREEVWVVFTLDRWWYQLFACEHRNWVSSLWSRRSEQLISRAPHLPKVSPPGSHH